ncbi:hypothetical protein [Sporosarcina sp. FSL K6-5500]|uniref:hypothetical protein n=1 Tax=Sporosarcina sp. FSL K6-5500 TaxID=2921558 RepID=UPI0030FBD9D2
MADLKSEDLEKLAELISDKVVAKLEDRIEFHLTSLMRERIYEVDTSDEYEYENQKSELESDVNYFSWEFIDSKWQLEVIDENLKDLIKEDLCGGSEGEYTEFLNKLQTDVIVSQTAKSLLDIVALINSLPIRKREKYKAVQKDLFYEFPDFRKEVIKMLEKFYEFKDCKKDKILEKIDLYYDYVHLQVPKVLMPVAAYVLMNLNILSKNNMLKLLNNETGLKLKALEDIYPKEEDEKVINSQVLFDEFIMILTSTENSSLNFYVFNTLTNLHDLQSMSNAIFKNSLTLKFFKTHPYEAYENLSSKIKYVAKEDFCNSVVNISKVDGILLKNNIMKKHINDDDFSSEKFVVYFNELFANCMGSFKEKISNTFNEDEKYKAIPEGIRSDYIVYKLFLNEEPYQEYLKGVSEKVHLTDLSNEKLEERMYYEVYYYTYKAIYKLNKRMIREDQRK